MHTQRTRSAARMAIALLLGALCAGCGHSGAAEPGRQTGVLDGMPFTVAAGSIQQNGAEQPVHAGPQQALLIFDETLGDVAPDARNLRVTATVELADGGSVAVGAFGAPDTLAGAYRIGASRQGAAFAYRYAFGPDGPSATGGFAESPRDPDATLYFRTEFRTQPQPALWAWTPWNAIPADCTAGPAGATAAPPDDPDLGDRLGIWLRDATLDGVSLLWPTYQGCPQ
jgi:hypothetical protein